MELERLRVKQVVSGSWATVVYVEGKKRVVVDILESFVQNAKEMFYQTNHNHSIATLCDIKEVQTSDELATKVMDQLKAGNKIYHHYLSKLKDRLFIMDDALFVQDGDLAVPFFPLDQFYEHVEQFCHED